MKSRFPSLAILIALFALTASAAWAGNTKVQVCHIPPGNPGNFHTITISESALQAHLGHGDLAGACFAHCDTLCSDGNACTIDACDASEHCVNNHPPVNCDDSKLCTADSCDPANGCANTPKTCSDGNNCTVDACDPVTGSCVAPPVFCPAGQICNPANGECLGGDSCAGVVCPLPDQCHQPGACSGGACTYPNKPDGTLCSDGNPDTIADGCFNGVCIPGDFY
jgi:Dictyostelium (slime mold) repeat